MKSIFKFLLVALSLFLFVNAQSEKKVTYGKSTFTVYKALPELAPTPVCGFKPDVPGYKLKSKNYGPGTYYCYAPGNVPVTNYKCILTEIRDWVAYHPDVVKEYAKKKGLVQVEEKAMKKMFKNTRLPQSGLMYKLTEDSWIYFYVSELENCGAADWSSDEPIVERVSFIQQVKPQTDTILDRLYRFWNDGVRFADYAEVTQSNFKTQPTAPTDQNPNNFSIGDVLNPKKGFYRLAFNGGAPTYVWHSYEKVVNANLQKSDFDASGKISYNDLLTAFDYELAVVKVGQNVYFSYEAQSRFLFDIEPGRSWQKEMNMRKEHDAKSKIEMGKLEKANAVALEKFYKEVFK